MKGVVAEDVLPHVVVPLGEPAQPPNQVGRVPELASVVEAGLLQAIELLGVACDGERVCVVMRNARRCGESTVGVVGEREYGRSDAQCTPV